MRGEAPNSVEVPVERLRRPEAADYCQRRLGQSVKSNTLRGWLVLYRQVGRDAVYELADLDRFIDARLAAAVVRLAGSGRQLAPSNLNPLLCPKNVAGL